MLGWSFRAFILGAGSWLLCAGAWAANDPSGIVLPVDRDQFSALVAKADAGTPNTDFHALRLAWLDSAAGKRGKTADLRGLRRDMAQAAQAKDMAKVADLARQALSVDFIDLMSLKLMSMACEQQNDEAYKKRYQSIEFGLVNRLERRETGKLVRPAGK